MRDGKFYPDRRVRTDVRAAVEAVTEAGHVVEELMRTRAAGTCGICGRRSRRKVCARADCWTEYERLYQADRRERRRALRGAR